LQIFARNFVFLQSDNHSKSDKPLKQLSGTHANKERLWTLDIGQNKFPIPSEISNEELSKSPKLPKLPALQKSPKPEAHKSKFRKKVLVVNKFSCLYFY
jgi:hypothetical protein